MLVSYVFGPRLPAHGRCITSKAELRALAKRPGEFACYVVEVCPACCLEPPRPDLPPEPARRRSGADPRWLRPPPATLSFTGGRYDPRSGTPVPAPTAMSPQAAARPQPKTTRSGR